MDERNLTHYEMICLSSGRDAMCKALNHCYYRLFKTVYGKFEEFGCDLAESQHAIAHTFPLANDTFQQICISSESLKLCYCTVSQCNQQWIISTMQRELNSSHMLYFLIALAFVIVSWNALLCYINWKCMKSIPSIFSSLLSRDASWNAQKCSLIPITLKILVMICLLISTWIPATVNCESDGVGRRHITEVVFLPQIFVNTSPISLCFIPFGLLPLIHIPLLVCYIIITITEQSYHVKTTNTFIIYYGILCAIIYSLSAYFMSKEINSFAESFQLKCTIKIKHWMVAIILAHVTGTLCVTIVLLLTITRFSESKNEPDIPLMNKDAESPEQVRSNLSVSTAHSLQPRTTTALHVITNHQNTIELSPLPFVVNSDSSGILNLRNAYSNQWVAIRLLTNNSELSIYPNKFLLPPERTSAAEITMTAGTVKERTSSRLLIQWYTAGAYCPARNVATLWTRPYYVPREQWHYKIIPVYSTFT
ncbi:unnamed protein product [Litomosoides sigmodontis]|uniref:Uncharacterized protein n=1 Tax=Litomosoides sigmodontis TaxID=42156 RepID=A0A3P6U408_LITSI|nr:unnamed protein product [Litomosoides sigmodontis]